MPDYFTMPEFRALPDVPAQTYPDAVVERAAAYFVGIVERELGVGFARRHYVETFDGTGGSPIILAHGDAVTLTSVTVDGVVLQLAGMVAQDGLVTGSGSRVVYFAPGAGNVVIEYDAGTAVCPPDIKDPVMWATRDRVISQSGNSGIDARKTSTTTQFGTTNYVLPGEDNPTGFPELDAAIAGRKNSGEPGFG